MNLFNSLNLKYKQFNQQMIFFCLSTIFIGISFAYVPEDSNHQYLLDKQIANYFPTWEVAFDSTTKGLRTSQGCLDFLNWYIDLDIRYEAYLSRILGIRYKNKYHGDYGEHISNHYFQPFFQVAENQRLYFSITSHYYKGEDEIGIGYFLGKDYLNYLEAFFIVDDFDRNFSLQHTEPGREKIIYKKMKYPYKFFGELKRNWNSGRLQFNFDFGFRYYLGSTDVNESYRKEGFKRRFNLRFWQDVKNFRFGIINNLKWQEIEINDTTNKSFQKKDWEDIIELMFRYKINDKWRPVLYLTYNYKTARDTINYRRDVFAYLVDLEFHPGGNFVWHFGTQRQFYNNNQGINFKDRRINLGLEYRYKNLWFYIVEAMEGDFPTPKYLHNHTYVQLMLRF